MLWVTVATASLLSLLKIVVFDLVDEVRNHLNRTMPGGGIGRRRPIATLLRPPDVTPMDFFVWGYVKNLISQVKNNDLQQMKTGIRNAVTSVIYSMLQNTWTGRISPGQLPCQQRYQH
jgi:hypothetical protein